MYGVEGVGDLADNINMRGISMAAGRRRAAASKLRRHAVVGHSTTRFAAIPHRRCACGNILRCELRLHASRLHIRNRTVNVGFEFRHRPLPQPCRSERAQSWI